MCGILDLRRCAAGGALAGLDAFLHGMKVDVQVFDHAEVMFGDRWISGGCEDGSAYC